MRVTVTSFFCNVISFLIFLETLIFYDQFSQPEVTRKCVLNVEKEICNLELCYPYISHPLSINNLYSCSEPALIVYQFRVSSYLLSFLSCLFMCVINNFALFFLLKSLFAVGCRIVPATSKTLLRRAFLYQIRNRTTNFSDIENLISLFFNYFW